MIKNPYSPEKAPECQVFTIKTQAIICQSIDGVSGNGLHGYEIEDNEENYLSF